MQRLYSLRLILVGLVASLVLIFAPIHPAEASFAVDSAITTTIKSKFLAEQNLSALDIKVETTKGVVTLRGQVAKQSQSKLAEKIARETEYVSKVINQISVKSKQEKKKGKGKNK